MHVRCTEMGSEPECCHGAPPRWCVWTGVYLLAFAPRGQPGFDFLAEAAKCGTEVTTPVRLKPDRDVPARLAAHRQQRGNGSLVRGR